MDSSLTLRGRLVVADPPPIGRLTVADGRILHVKLDDQGPADLDVGERLILPGFVDVHVHGAGGAGAMDGPAAIGRMGAVLARHGVTAFLPTAVSAPIERLAAFVAEVGEARREAERTPAGGASKPTPRAEILGANLEGPALDPGHRGAHNPAVLVDPAVLLAAWQSAPERWAGVRVVTLAPERPGGMDLLAGLVAAGVVASIGHTGASFEEAWAAYDAGAASTTHLFNAMTGLHHRAPGVVGAALLHQRPAVELIADGVHVVAPLWPLLWRVAGERLLVVSDALPAAGVGDGTLDLGGLQVTVRGPRATLADGTIAGSVTLLDGAWKNLLAAGIPPWAASRALSETPARLLGLNDRGTLAPGARADLVVSSPQGDVERVMIGGLWVDGDA
jgi:N-acetylglucosamine-6-phosphate deacetylase